MSYQLTGVIKTLGDTVQVTEKFSKREFVVEVTESMYPQTILLQAVQDKCSMLDGYMEGETVEVSWNLNGREWVNPQGETKVFNSLDCWRIEKVGANTQDSPTPKASQPATATGEDDDDLPF